MLPHAGPAVGCPQAAHPLNQHLFSRESESESPHGFQKRSPAPEDPRSGQCVPHRPATGYETPTYIIFSPPQFSRLELLVLRQVPALLLEFNKVILQATPMVSVLRNFCPLNLATPRKLADAVLPTRCRSASWTPATFSRNPPKHAGRPPHISPAHYVSGPSPFAPLLLL